MRAIFRGSAIEMGRPTIAHAKLLAVLYGILVDGPLTTQISVMAGDSLPLRRRLKAPAAAVNRLRKTADRRLGRGRKDFSTASKAGAIRPATRPAGGDLSQPDIERVAHIDYLGRFRASVDVRSMPRPRARPRDRFTGLQPLARGAEQRAAVLRPSMRLPGRCFERRRRSAPKRALVACEVGPGGTTWSENFQSMSRAQGTKFGSSWSRDRLVPARSAEVSIVDGLPFKRALSSAPLPKHRRRGRSRRA